MDNRPFKILVTGACGMLGTDVLKAASGLAGVEAQGVDMADFDLLDTKAAAAYIARFKPDAIVHCAAFTNVDAAEARQEEAFKINAMAVRDLAVICAEGSIKLALLSTDYVFDGEKQGEYREDDATVPIGEYGRSKLEGERHIAATMNEFFIIRTAWLYGSTGNNFVRTMLRLFMERAEVRVVNDQWGSPTYTGDLAEVILKIVDDDSEKYGLYHYTNEGRTNWYEFARQTYSAGRHYGLVKNDVHIIPIATAEYPTRARRPKNSYVSKDKIRRNLGVKARPWEEALDDCIKMIAGSSASLIELPENRLHARHI